LLDQEQIGPKDSRYTIRDYAYGFASTLLWDGDDFELTLPFVETLLAKGLLDVDRVLLEGQFPDQRLLEEHSCAQCGTLLRQFCTDY
jgi:hypothetical protein